MISKALFREQIKVQFYLYTILLFLYQIYDGLYGLYHIDPKIIHHGMITDYEGTFADFKGSVINSTMVWLLAILVLVFMQFSFLRKKENLSFLGSLPITRQKIITTTYLSGLTILAGEAEWFIVWCYDSDVNCILVYLYGTFCLTGIYLTEQMVGDLNCSDNICCRHRCCCKCNSI